MNIKSIGKKLGVITATVAIAASLTLVNGGKANADTGFFAGTWSGYQNSLNIAPSLTGDSLFGYNNGCAYGDFSHVGLCYEGSYYSNGKWDGRCLEATNVDTPSGSNCVYNNHWQSHFLNYDAASLDYFAKSGYTFNGNSIVQKANSYAGAYDWMSSFSDNSKWYCSKLVSRAVNDVNGYNLGFLFWGSFISPGDIWWDSAVWERTYSVSAGYNGGSVYAKTSSPALAMSSTPQTMTTLSSTSSPTTMTYNGATVQSTNTLDKETQKVAEDRINAEKAAGKAPNSMNIVAANTKPGLNNYLKELISSGKATKEQVKAKWNVTDAALK